MTGQSGTGQSGTGQSGTGQSGRQADAFLVIIDDTSECDKALRYAALRASHTDATAILLRVLAPAGFQQWSGVQHAIDDELAAEAQQLLAEKAALAESWTGHRPEVRLLRGPPTQRILETLAADRSIRALVLAAAAKGRPGPLIEYFAGEKAGGFPCMIIIVPGAMDDAEIDRLT